MDELSEQIRTAGVELGFQAIGIVPATALAEEGDRLGQWLGLGFHADMAWMEYEPEKRADPRILFPGARSVIVGTVNYFTPHKHSNSPDKGKISRYAWGDDYHDVLRERLNALLEFISTLSPGVKGKVCVDTAPFMDKAWAARAGLGWIGKHSNLITTDAGSWVFIGSLLVDIELSYDGQIVDDHCGTCTRCLDACPTDAIAVPYVVDARRCISSTLR